MADKIDVREEMEKMTSKDMQASIVRDICRRLDDIEKAIDSGKINSEILPEYVRERSRLNRDLKQFELVRRRRQKRKMEGRRRAQ